MMEGLSLRINEGIAEELAVKQRGRANSTKRKASEELLGAQKEEKVELSHRTLVKH